MGQRGDVDLTVLRAAQSADELRPDDPLRPVREPDPNAVPERVSLGAEETTVQSIELRVTELEAALKEEQGRYTVLYRRFQKASLENSQLTTTNRYLTSEVAAYFKESVALRQVFQELSDPDGHFERHELQFELVRFITNQPMRLSDGEIRLVAPVAAWYAEECARIQDESHALDANKEIAEDARSAARSKSIDDGRALHDAFRLKLVGILGEERVAMYMHPRDGGDQGGH